MSARCRIRFVPLPALLALLTCAADPSPESLLLVTFDTTRADFVTGFGGAPAVTPNIAALARRSTSFTRAHSESNVTNPSHVTIMSGMPSHRHGVFGNHSQLPDSVDTLPEAFRRAGFATAGFVGASHVGPWLGWRGFDVLEAPERTYSASRVTRFAVRWLREHQQRPFFLWVHYFDPHMFYSPSPESARLFYQGNPRDGDGSPIREWPAFKAGMPGSNVVEWLGDVRDPEWPRAMYAAEIHDTDAALGELLRALPPRNTTAVIVTADHGESLGEHGIFYGHRGIYEAQLRVPLLIHVPGASSVRSDVPASTLDIAPTVVELFGLDLRNEIGGLSLVSAMRDSPAPELLRRSTFVHTQAHRHAFALREGDWKLVWQRRLTPGVQLFDLAEDPGELENLADREPARVAAMRSEIEARVSLTEVGAEAQPLDAGALDHLRALGYGEP